MTSFTDGPAKGITLCIRRAPLFLRVVKNRKGEWDALDQLKDQPELTEEVFVYRKVSGDNTPSVHVCGTRHGKRWGGFFCQAVYRLADEQPDDATARSSMNWPKWCGEQYDKIKAAIEEKAGVKIEADTNPL